MSGIFTGIVFLVVGTFVLIYNEESQTQIVFPGVGPNNTSVILLSLGLLFVLKGGFSHWRRRRAQRAFDEEMKS